MFPSEVAILMAIEEAEELTARQLTQGDTRLPSRARRPFLETLCEMKLGLWTGFVKGN